MTTYKLTYFNLEAKGELVRFIFAQAGVKYEDTRIEFKDWPPLKPLTPFGVLPFLEIDSQETVAGSGVIGRYLGEKLGLAGSNDLDNLKIASIKDFQDDLVKKMVLAFFEKDETKKAEMSKDLSQQSIPYHLEILEKIIKRNPAKAGSCWLYGPKVTYVDLNLYLLVDFMKMYKSDFLDANPEVKKIYDEVGALTKIADWIKSRPERTFGPPVA